MFKITNILNPLTGGATTAEHEWVKGQPLSEYMDYDGECVVACARRIIELPLSKIFPANTDEYTVMPILEGGDKQTQRVMAYFALSASLLAIPGTQATAWHGFYMGQIGKGMAGYMGATLINLFLQDKEKDKASQSYSWQHKSSPTAYHGIPMPIIYGKARVRPTLKNRYVVIDGDKQYLYALYGLAAHKVDERSVPRWSDDPPRIYTRGDEVRTILAQDEPGKTYTCIRDHDQNFVVPFYINPDYWKIGHGTASFIDDVIINGRSIGGYNRDVEWETRPGLPQQAVIAGFNVTYSNSAQDRILYIDEPEVNRNTARITYTSSFRLLAWQEHDILFHGESYRIRAGHATLAFGHIYYLYFDPSVDANDYLLSRGAVPAFYVILSVNTLTNEIIWTESLPSDTDWFSPILPATSAHNIELTFEFPFGIYGIAGGESMVSQTCRLFAQYREVGTSRWLNFSSGFSTPDHRHPYDNSDIEAIVITRKKQEMFSTSIKATLGSADFFLDDSKVYEVRVAASSPSIVRLVNVATIIYGVENMDESFPGFTYPGEPLLGIKALASGQIDGDLDVQVDAERSKVWVYNTRTVGGVEAGWVEGAANNHAWAVYDILANGHPDHPAYPSVGNADAETPYGCGIDYRRLDYESFRTWAENIGDLEYELNIVSDTFMTAWDAILRICQEGRGMVYPVGTKIFAFTDKAEDVSQVFTMGNIHRDTFVQKFVEANQKINMVEVTYYDQDRNYEKTMIAARTADWDSSTGLSIPVTITLYGTTTFNQAWSIARFILRGNELLDSIITYGVDIDGLAAQAGDVIEVQHDVLTVGQGGRIIGVVDDPVTGVTLTFDRILSIGALVYELEVAHSDGTIESKSVHGGGDTDVLTFPITDPWIAVPEVYEVYSFGVDGEHAKKYRITNISRTNELMRTLTLVQYDENMYDVYVPSDPVLETEDGGDSASKIVPPDTTVEEVANLLNLASNVQLREVVSENRATGEYTSSIVVTWDTVLGDPRGSWEVWFRDVDVSDVDWQGTWGEGTYRDGDKVELGGKTYISLTDENTSEPFTRTMF